METVQGFKKAVGEIPVVPRPADVVFIAACLFLAGVFCAGNGWGIGYSIILGITLYVICARILFPSKQALYIFLLICFVAGFFMFHVHYALYEEYALTLSKYNNFQGVIISDPERREQSQIFIVRLNNPFEWRMRVVLPPFPQYKYGDELGIQGTLQAQMPKSDKNFFPVMIFPEIIFIRAHKASLFRERLFEIKHALINSFKKILPPQSASLLSGLVLGVREEFDDDFKNAMSKSGTTHIVALSGYNIAILVSIIARTLGLRLSRRGTLMATIALIVLFVGAVGGEASIVRAALMGLLLLFAREEGRLYNTRNAIVFAASSMVIYDPTILNFDLGFQLSFLALLGIVYLRPIIQKAWDSTARFIRSARGRFDSGQRVQSFFAWKENAITTCAAQLAVAPIIISAFQSISLTSLAANVLILGVVPLTMGVGFIAGVFGMIFEPFGILVGLFVDIFLTYMIGVIHFFAIHSIPFSFTMNSFFIICVYYVFCVMLIAWNMRREIHEKHS